MRNSLSAIAALFLFCGVSAASVITNNPYISHSHYSFDVTDGVTNWVTAVMVTPAADWQTAVKTGGGTLYFTRGPIDAQLHFLVRSGVVRFAKGVRVSASSVITICPGARVELDDGAELACAVNSVDELLMEADIWVDASSISEKNGYSARSIPNLGRVGGSFTNDILGYGNGGQTAAPMYTNQALNARSALSFGGFQGTKFVDYVNKGESGSDLMIFSVARLDSWGSGRGEGGYGGLWSFSHLAATMDDNKVDGAVHEEYGSGTAKSIFAYNAAGGQGASVLQVTGLAPIGTPFQDTVAIGRDAIRFHQFFGTDAEGVSGTFTRPSGFPYTPNIDVVGLGTRLGPYGSYNHGRAFKGLMGELIVFSRALTEAETVRVQSYLRDKWFGTSVFVSRTEDVDAPAICVPSGTAVWSGGVADGAGLVKTGAGTLRVAEGSSATAVLRVKEGALSVSSASLLVPAVWMDAADAVTNATGRIESVPNKGFSGGAFLKAAVEGDPTPTPFLGTGAEGIGGLPALKMDKSGMMLTTWTNRSQPRAVSVYGVFQRDEKWTPGVYSAPWILASIDPNVATNHDTFCPGLFFVEDSAATNTINLQYGLRRATPDMNVEGFTGRNPYLQVATLANRRAEVTIEEKSLSGESSPVTVSETTQFSLFADPFSVDVVVLGGRLSSGKFRLDSKMWPGKIGELLVFEQELPREEEAALLSYLREKWFKGKADAVPPSFLNRAESLIALGGTSLTFADGTAFKSDAETLSIGTLATEGTVAFARTDQSSTPAFFAVMEDVSMAGSTVSLQFSALKDETELIQFDGVATSPTWRLLLNGMDATDLWKVYQRPQSFVIGLRKGTLFLLQ